MRLFKLKMRGSPRKVGVGFIALLLGLWLALGVFPPGGKARADGNDPNLGILSAQLEEGSCFAGDPVFDPPAHVKVTLRGEPGVPGTVLVNNQHSNDDMTFSGGVQSYTADAYATGKVVLSLGYNQHDDVTAGVYKLTKTVTIPKCGVVTKPTVNLTASSTSLTVGQSTTLSWTSKNAVSLMASGAWNGSKVVPSGSQVVTPGAAGTYAYKLVAKSSGGDTASDSVTVTVKAPAPTHVTATPPSFTDKCGVDNDVYTIPSEEGVAYYVNGVAKAAGTYPGSGSVTVTAKAADGYVLDGDSSWSHTFSTEPCVTPPTHVTAKAPSVKADKCGVDDDTYSIPSVKGVDYYVDGEVVLAGSHSTKGALKVVVTAKAQKGYVLDGDSSWTLNFTDEPCTTPPTKVTATAPTSVDECGTANDTYTIPSTEGVQYYVDGDAVSAGTYPTDGALKVKVTAKAKDGYVLEGKSSWTLKFTDEPCTTPPPAQNPSIEAKASCGQVKFTNPNGFAVEVWYGNKSGSKVDGDIVVQANGSKVVKTSRTTLYYVIGKDGQAADEVYSVNVPQGCGTTPPTSPPTSPTSSPTTKPTGTPTGTPTSTATGTPTSTGTNPPTATSTSSSSSTTKSGGTSTTTSGVTGPKVVTDGMWQTHTGPNWVGIGGLAAFAVLIGGAFVAFRRIRPTK